jgi:putative nucleotidyltransferase with HDIG domain
VTTLAMDIGRELGLPSQDVDLLHRGGLLHDIGKIGIPPSILNKPERLTEEETGLMQGHPSAGAKILGPIPNLQKVIPVVSQHHERFDGKGYPGGLSGDSISLHARILALADVFDALSSDRPYRPGLSRDAVVDHIRMDAGRHFDPAVVEAFLRIEARRNGDGIEETSRAVAAASPAVPLPREASRGAFPPPAATCGAEDARFTGIANHPFVVSGYPPDIKKVKANRHFEVDRQYEDF